MTDQVSQPVMEATVIVDHDEVIDERESHTPQDIKREYRSWIREPIMGGEGQSHITFQHVTFAQQLEREPIPKVRIALLNNDGPHPLLSGARLKTCHPVDPDELTPPSFSTVHGYRVSYRWNGSPSQDPEEHARAMLRMDLNQRHVRYDVQDITSDSDLVTIRVAIPASDTGNLTAPQRLFPTAEEIEYLEKDDIEEVEYQW
jgi:hypothetical protein